MNKSSRGAEVSGLFRMDRYTFTIPQRIGIMNKDKCSPGEWSADIGADEDRGRYSVLIDSDQSQYPPGTAHGGSFEEAMANAHLFAASKTMLKALENIKAYEDRGRAKGEPRISDTWYEEVVSAINRAKGLEE